MDDKHILARARRGELDAFEELVRRYEKRVYVIALRSSGNPEDAADITQEVFLRAWRSIENFRGDSGFSTWLFRITMNICVDHARHRQDHSCVSPPFSWLDGAGGRMFPLCSKILRRAMRARASRDFTVPSLISRISAISE